MAWRQTGDKTLSEPMRTQLTEAYMLHQGGGGGGGDGLVKHFPSDLFQSSVLFIYYRFNAISVKMTISWDIRHIKIITNICPCYIACSSPTQEMKSFPKYNEVLSAIPRATFAVVSGIMTCSQMIPQLNTPISCIMQDFAIWHSKIKCV